MESVDFSQAANGTAKDNDVGDITWINGIVQKSNSTYFEGMSVMQRVVLQGFTDADGLDATLHFHVDATKGGIHAYDFLTSYDQAITAAAGDRVPYVNIEVDPHQNALHAGIERNLTVAQATADLGNGSLPADTAAAINGFYIDVLVPDDPYVDSTDGAYQTRIKLVRGDVRRPHDTGLFDPSNDFGHAHHRQP